MSLEHKSTILLPEDLPVYHPEEELLIAQARRVNRDRSGYQTDTAFARKKGRPDGLGFGYPQRFND